MKWIISILSISLGLACNGGSHAIDAIQHSAAIQEFLKTHPNSSIEIIDVPASGTNKFLTFDSRIHKLTTSLWGDFTAKDWTDNVFNENAPQAVKNAVRSGGIICVISPKENSGGLSIHARVFIFNQTPTLVCFCDDLFNSEPEAPPANCQCPR